MKRWFKDLPLRHKLLILLCIVSAVASTLCTGVLLFYDHQRSQKALQHHLSSVADVVAFNTLAALAFGDSDTATKTLASLEREPSVDSACLYDLEGKFATYLRDERIETDFPRSAPEAGVRQSAGTIELCAPVKDVDGTIGHLFLRANTRQLQAEVRTKLLIATAVLAGGFVVAALLAFQLQTFVSRPIVQLATAAREIESTGDYSNRVTHDADDEVGWLYAAFNDMLSRIDEHQDALREAQRVLEERVDARTKELSRTNKDLTSEIRQHEVARRELESTQQKLVEAARLAGMADIATGVLHNVGNVLNSVNVRLNIMAQHLESGDGQGQQLIDCAKLLTDNGSKLGPFLVEDERGKHIPDFVRLAGEQQQQHWQSLSDDVGDLRTFFRHIWEIVASQQSLAKVSGTRSRMRLSELFAEAIVLNDAGLTRHEIEVHRDYMVDPEINSDRHRILQILVNLISNAKHALAEHCTGQRMVKLSIAQIEPETVVATVTDNGVGIGKNSIDRIFQSGYTTKPNGHGYGLHTSAIAAQELGGSLEVHSDGEGRGAQFTLTLPINASHLAP